MARGWFGMSKNSQASKFSANKPVAPDRERFVESYRKAGGHLELELFEGEAEGFIGRNSSSPNAARAIEKIIEFVHKQIC